MDIILELQEGLYINHCGISWPIFSCSLNFFSYEDSWPGPSASLLSTEETQEKHKTTLMPLNQQLKGICIWNTPLICCSWAYIGAVTKHDCKNLTLVLVPSDTPATVWSCGCQIQGRLHFFSENLSML